MGVWVYGCMGVLYYILQRKRYIPSDVAGREHKVQLKCDDRWPILVGGGGW